MTEKTETYTYLGSLRSEVLWFGSERHKAELARRHTERELDNLQLETQAIPCL